MQPSKDQPLLMHLQTSILKLPFKPLFLLLLLRVGIVLARGVLVMAILYYGGMAT